jgi:hypothetical protein
MVVACLSGMAPVDTKNPPPDNVQDITTASGNGQRRRAKPVPQHSVEPTAPLIDSPGDVDLFDMDPASIVTPRRYHDELPAAPVAPLEEPGDSGTDHDHASRDAPSCSPSQSAEELVDEVQHPIASPAAASPFQSDDALIEQLEEIHQGSSGAIPPVTGTAYLPADTPTSRPKPPRHGRAPRTRRTPRPTLTRRRTRKAYLSAAALLVIAVAIAAVATNGSPRTRTASAATGVKSGLVVTPTKTMNPLERITAVIAPAVKKHTRRRTVKHHTRSHARVHTSTTTPRVDVNQDNDTARAVTPTPAAAASPPQATPTRSNSSSQSGGGATSPPAFGEGGVLGAGHAG